MYLPFLVAQTLSRPILPILHVYLQIAHLAGLDVKKEYSSPTGRPFELADKGKIIIGILS